MAVFDLSAAQAHPNFATASVCIVGGGMAGLVLAESLARSGIKTLVLESGGLVEDAATEGLNSIENVDGLYQGAFKSRCRGLGGTSRRWGGRTIPISTYEAGPRDYLDQPGWPFPIADLDRYSARIEALFGLANGSYQHEASAPAPFGFPAVDADFDIRWAKWPRFARCNLATVLRRDLRHLPHLTIWTGATVCGFTRDPDNGRLVGVSARDAAGHQLSVQAEHFVLAAGTIETTRLLLWLDRLAQNRLFAPHAGLGRYFQDHLNVRAATISRHNPALSNALFSYRFVKGTRRSLHLELSGPAQRQERVAGAFAYVSMDLAGSPLGTVKSVARSLQRGHVDMAGLASLSRSGGLLARSAYWRYARQQLFVPPDIAFNLEICVEQRPDPQNRIVLSDQPDALGLPRVRLHWRPTLADEYTFRAAIRRLDGFWTRAGFAQECPLVWSAACADPQMRVIDHAEDYYHPSGTARMGHDPARSVVGPDLTCHAVPNLSVLSAAVFPTAGSANPTFTLLRLALRLGDFLHNQPRLHSAAPIATTLARPDRANSPSGILPGALH